MVVGFRPDHLARPAGAPAPTVLHGFNGPVVGPDGFTMPATQYDQLLWLAGSAYDVVFDVAHAAMAALAPVAAVADETSSWPYRHNAISPASSTKPRTRASPSHPMLR